MGMASSAAKPIDKTEALDFVGFRSGMSNMSHIMPSQNTGHFNNPGDASVGE